MPVTSNSGARHCRSDCVAGPSAAPCKTISTSSRWNEMTPPSNYPLTQFSGIDQVRDPKPASPGAPTTHPAKAH